MADRPNLMNFLTKEVEVDSDREGGRSSGGSDPLRSPEVARRFMGGEVIVPDGVGVVAPPLKPPPPPTKNKLEQAIMERRELHGDSGTKLAEILIKKRQKDEPENREGSASQEATQPPPTSPVPSNEAEVGRYIRVIVPQEYAPKLTPSTGVVHTSLLNQKIQPTTRTVDWNHIDFTKAVLLLDTDGAKSLGIIPRYLLSNAASLSTQNVVLVTSCTFHEKDLPRVVTTDDWETRHCVDEAWIHLSEWGDMKGMPEGNYLGFLLKKHERLTKPMPVVKLPEKSVRGEVIELEDDEPPLKKKTAWRDVMMKQKQQQQQPEIVLEIPKKPKPSQRALLPTRETREVIDLDNDDDENDDTEWRTRTDRRAKKRKSQPETNSIFAPHTDLETKYPCKSAFHEKYAAPRAHGSRQCKFCSSCHWMEVLFNGEDAYCSWRHEPTLTKINRSKLSKSDKALAVKRFKVWAKEVDSEDKQPAGSTATTTRSSGTLPPVTLPPPPTIKKEHPKEVKKEPPAARPPAPPSDDDEEEIDLFARTFSPPKKYKNLPNANPASTKPDEDWEW